MPIGGADQRSQIALLPHQEQFVETALGPESKRVTTLVAPPGAGKVAALLEVVRRAHGVRGQAKVLVLAHKIIGKEYVRRLSDTGVSADVVDRYHFRALRDAFSHGSVWPAGFVAVLTTEFASQTDVAQSLTSVQWDLVITDEVDPWKIGPESPLWRVLSSARRVVAAWTLGDRPPLAFDEDEVSRVVWRLGELVDAAGRSLVGPKPEYAPVSYLLNSRELSVVQGVSEICSLLQRIPSDTAPIVAASLMKRLESSTSTLESGLRNWISQLAAGQAEVSMGEADDGDAGPPFKGELPAELAERVALASIELLGDLDFLEEDSKSACLLTLLGDLRRSVGRPSRICVVTKYLQTLFYLETVVEECGGPIFTLHGSIEPAARPELIRQFDSEGGVLIATQALLARGGVNLPVDALITYEVPTTQQSALLLLSSFATFYRRDPLRIHALIPENWPDPMFIAGERFLREAVAERSDDS